MKPSEVLDRAKEMYPNLDWYLYEDINALDAHLQWLTLRVQPRFVNDTWLQVRVEIHLPASAHFSKSIHGEALPRLILFGKWHNDTLVARPEFVRKEVDRLLDEPRRYLRRLHDSAAALEDRP